MRSHISYGICEKNVSVEGSTQVNSKHAGLTRFKGEIQETDTHLNGIDNGEAKQANHWNAQVATEQDHNTVGSTHLILNEENVRPHVAVGSCTSNR